MQEADKDEEFARALHEKQSEMALAIEERELQKMAALSQQDNKTDELQQRYEDVKQVHRALCDSTMCILHLHVHHTSHAIDIARLCAF